MWSEVQLTISAPVPEASATREEESVVSSETLEALDAKGETQRVRIQVCAHVARRAFLAAYTRGPYTRTPRCVGTRLTCLRPLSRP